MKVVFASIPSQEEKISELVRYIYSDVFPIYFSDEKINEFEGLNILLAAVQHFEEINTLKDAFQVMASLQTLISILESSTLDEQYAEIFNKNVSTLHEFGIFFPFEFEQFAEAKNIKNNIFSVYTKAANELLV